MNRTELDAILAAALKSGSIPDFRGADLSGANLSGAYLSGAYLSGADFRGAILSGAYLSGADLSDAIFIRADLSGADFRGVILKGAYLIGADLKGAYLSGADLKGANLSGTIGNNREIKSVQTCTWSVTYTSDIMQIGCKIHPIDDWWTFTDADISRMEPRALKWWTIWKPILQQIIAAGPATPTNAKRD